MILNILIPLVIGAIPLLLLTGAIVRGCLPRPTERDVLLRGLFVVLLLFPVCGLLMPRLTLVSLSTHQRSETIATIAGTPIDMQTMQTSPMLDPAVDRYFNGVVGDRVEPDVSHFTVPKSRAAFDETALQVPQVSESAHIVTLPPEYIPVDADQPSDDAALAAVTTGSTVSTGDMASNREATRGVATSILVLIPVLLFAIWVFGMLPGLFLLVRSRVIYSRIINAAEPLCDWRWIDLCEELQQTLGFKRAVRYRVSEVIGVPQVVGLRYPTVLLPKHLLAEKPNRAVLIHELAHIKRNDIVWQLLVSVVCMMYWFQPLVWRLAAAIRTAREEVCDDCVLYYGEKGADYAEVLLSLSSLVQRGYRLPERIGCAVTMPSQQNQIEQRIISLLDPNKKREPVTMKTKLLIIIGVVAAAMLSVAICPAFVKANAVETNAVATPEASATTTDLTTTQQNAVLGTDGDYVTDPQSIGVQPIPGLSFGESNVPIRGEVQWENGTTAAGADVTIIFNHGKRLDLKTDENGRFLLWSCATNRANQDIRMIVRAENANNNREICIGVQKTDKDNKEYKIVLKTGRIVSGTVTAKSGKALDEFYVGTSEYGFSRVTGKSDFSLLLPDDPMPEMLFAWSAGEGFTYKIFRNDDHQAEAENDPLDIDIAKSVDLTLDGAAPFTIQAIDTDGNGIGGIEFNIWGITYPPYMANGELKTANAVSLPLPVRTDENGTATIDWFPNWSKGRLTIDPVQLNDGPNRYVRTKEFWPVTEGQPLRFVQELIKTVPVSGTVKYPDGKPVAGLRITAEGQGITLNDRWNVTTTDADGKYVFQLAP